MRSKRRFIVRHNPVRIGLVIRLTGMFAFLRIDQVAFEFQIELG